jgi:small subunit ribosomal protein S5
MIEFNMDGETICHEVETRSTGADVLMKPAAPGTGIIAGGVVRSIIGLTGIKNLISKSLGSTNKVNIAYAVIDGLREQLPRDEWIGNQGKKSAEKKATKSATKEDK